MCCPHLGGRTGEGRTELSAAHMLLRRRQPRSSIGSLIHHPGTGLTCRNGRFPINVAKASDIVTRDLLEQGVIIEARLRDAERMMARLAVGEL